MPDAKGPPGNGGPYDDYTSIIASTGHTSTHEPHSVHAS